jgi:hypothetical protein
MRPVCRFAHHPAVGGADRAVCPGAGRRAILASAKQFSSFMFAPAVAVIQLLRGGQM